MPQFRQKQSPQEAHLKGVKKENASAVPGERFKREIREAILASRGGLDRNAVNDGFTVRLRLAAG